MFIIELEVVKEVFMQEISIVESVVDEAFG